MLRATCVVGTNGKPCHGGAETGAVSGTGDVVILLKDTYNRLFAV